MSTLGNFSLDKVKNLAEDAFGSARGMRDDTEKKVFEALNNKNWGASSTTLQEIARETYDYEKFHKIFKLIWEAAESPARNWRKIFKSLMLCEYLVKNGAERCVDEIRDHTFKIRQLQDFRYTEESLDRGQGTREKAKQLLELLSDNATIREARENAKRLRDKLGGGGSRFSGSGGYGNDSFSSSSYSGGGTGPVGYGGGGYSDNGNRGQSTGRYSDGGIPSTGPTFSSNSTDAPGRYARDDGNNTLSNTSFEEPSPPSVTPAINLKLKPKSKPVPRLKIKGETAAPAAQLPPAATTQENFFDSAAPQQQNTPATDLFDAFSEPVSQPPQTDFADFNSVPPQQQQQAQQPVVTDNFAAFPPAAPQLDAFAQQVPLQPARMGGMQTQQPIIPQQPMQQPTNMMAAFGSSMQAPMQPQQQQQQPAFGQPYNAGNGMMMGAGNSMMAQQPPRPTAPMAGMPYGAPPQQQQQRQPAMSGDDFGDFEASPAAVQAPIQKSPEQAILEASSSLVSLDGLSKNTSASKSSSPAAAKASYAQHSAFTGLDGFNTTPQPTMMNSASPNFQQPLNAFGNSGAPPAGPGYGMAPPARQPQMQQMYGQPAGYQQQPMPGTMGMQQPMTNGMQQPYYQSPQQGGAQQPMGNPYGGW